MPEFKVKGKGTKTGRIRTRVYRATSEEEAIKLANDDKTEVTSVERLPDKPASQAQIEYARDLGLTIPANPTSEQMSELISNRPPTKRQKEYARDLGIKVTKHATYEEVSELIDKKKNPPANPHYIEMAKAVGVEVREGIPKKELFDTVVETLKTEKRNEDLVAWFVYRVCQHFAKKKSKSTQYPPNSPQVRVVAAKLVQDQKVLSSIKRYSGRDTIWFGTWTTPRGEEVSGGSIRTAGFRATADAIQETMGLRISHPKSKGRGKDSETSGCIGTTVIFIIFVIAGVTIYRYLSS